MKKYFKNLSENIAALAGREGMFVAWLAIVGIILLLIVAVTVITEGLTHSPYSTIGIVLFIAGTYKLTKWLVHQGSASSGRF